MNNWNQCQIRIAITAKNDNKHFNSPTAEIAI